MTRAEDPRSSPAFARVQVIDRSVVLLNALALGSLSLTELSRTTGLSKGTVYRLLAGLACHGLVMRDTDNSGYMLGPALLRFTHGAVAGLGALAATGSAVLQDLQQRTGETVALHAQCGLERVCIGEIPSSKSIVYTSGVGSTAPLSVGAAGKILVAMMPPDRREQTLHSLLTLQPELSIPRLRREIDSAAVAGLAMSSGERVEGASAVSVPVTASPVLLALTVLGPTARMDEGHINSMLPDISAAARTLKALYDYRPTEKARSS